MSYGSASSPGASTSSNQAALAARYEVTAWAFLPLLLVVVLSVLRVPPFLAILGGALAGGVMAVLLQPGLVLQHAARPDLPAWIGLLKGVWEALASGFVYTSGDPDLDRLLSRGGMDSMLNTIWLIMAALAFGSILDEFGFLSKLVTPLLTRARNTGNLIATSVLTAFGLNVATADQYVAVVLPIKLFRGEFEKRDLATKNLSRIVSNGGIVTSPLIPWNSCGAFMAAAMGVPTMVYAPYAIFNYVSPLLDIVFGYMGFKVARADGSAGIGGLAPDAQTKP